jgi:serine/threonine protein phosphatase PrpC
MRVNGSLGVSRAIGDKAYKPHVIARPEILTIDLEIFDSLLILASDGLFESSSVEKVCARAYELH